MKICGDEIPDALFRLYVGCVRESSAGVDVQAADWARSDAHSMILEYCTGDPDKFEKGLERLVEGLVRIEGE